MSGYLTRLAERALNQAPVVHANARLPFVEPPQPSGDVPPSRIGVDVTQPSLSASAAPPALEKVPAPLEVRADVSPSTHVAVPRLDSVPAPRIDRESVRDATRESERRRSDVPANERPTLRVAEDRTRIDVDARRGDSTPRAPVGVSSREATRTPATSAVPRLPALIAANARKSDPAPRVAAAEAPQPDVHIHIGRIELTAVPERAPSRPARTSKKPMTLDEYLQGRGGRST